MTERICLDKVNGQVLKRIRRTIFTFLKEEAFRSFQLYVQSPKAIVTDESLKHTEQYAQVLFNAIEFQCRSMDKHYSYRLSYEIYLCYSIESLFEYSSPLSSTLASPRGYFQGDLLSREASSFFSSQYSSSS